MSYNVNEGGDHRQYINPYDNAVVTCYISKSKKNFNIVSSSGGNSDSTLLIDLEALCSPQGPLECSLPNTLGRFVVNYRNLVLKNMGYISRNDWICKYTSYNTSVKRTLYFSGRTDIKGLSDIRGYFDYVCADQAALSYSGMTASSFGGTVASPPARPSLKLSNNTWIKVNGTYMPAQNYMKIVQEWRPVCNVYQKVNGAWKRTTAIGSYRFCEVEDALGNSWLSDFKRGGFNKSGNDCYASGTNSFQKNEIFFARFNYPPLEGYDSKSCYICNGSEYPKYELINASSIDTGIYKMQFTGSVFKVIS